MSSALPGEQKLTRQQHKSDVKQKGVCDKRCRDAACYPFITIKMESFESQKAVLLLSSNICTSMKYYVSARCAQWCRQCLNPCDMHIRCTHADSEGFGELTPRSLAPPHYFLDKLLLITALYDKTSLSLEGRISRKIPLLYCSDVTELQKETLKYNASCFTGNTFLILVHFRAINMSVGMISEVRVKLRFNQNTIYLFFFFFK